MNDGKPLAATVRRFSDVAIFAVAVVAVTGVTMAWIILPGAGELTSTGYGLALIVKVALVVVLIALGAFNRYRLIPAVDVGAVVPGSATDHDVDTRARRTLGTIVRVELVLLVAVVGVTAVIVTRSPLSSTTAAATAPAAASESDLATITLSNDGGLVDVTVTPGQAGPNSIDLILRDTEGRTINPYEAPVVELSLSAADIGPLRPALHPLGIGHYQAHTDLSIAGTWDLAIRVRIEEFESVAGTTPVTIE
jgi:copper transport protein